jgi:4-phytase/acid phosphatase
MRLLLAVITFLASQSWTSHVSADSTDKGDLLRFVIVSRHGVRAPLTKPDELALWADRNWPELSTDWQVQTPGDLTPTGKALVRLMGQYYRTLLASEDLLPLHTCPAPANVFVWADVDRRTLDTGKALLEGVVGGCPGFAIHSSDSNIDPLFHPIKAGVCSLERERTEAAILGRVGGDFGRVQRAEQAALETLQTVLGCCKPDLCHRFGKPEGCTLPMLGSHLKWHEPTDSTKGNPTISLEGTLGISSTVAEILLLEYASGFKGEKWGFGRVDRDQMLQTSRLHTLLFDIMERTPYLAKRQGSELLKQVASTLLRAAGVPELGPVWVPKRATFVAFVGHDTNIANLAAMLNVSWQQPEYQMNDTPPAGALIFELRRGNDHRLRVFTSYIAQSPQQMAEMRRLDLDHPPHRTELFVPECSSSEPGYPCLLQTFHDAALRALDRQCVRPTTPEHPSIPPQDSGQVGLRLRTEPAEVAGTGAR